MSTTWNGIACDGYKDPGQPWVPNATARRYVNTKHIPYTNRDDVQGTGTGFYRLRYTARVAGVQIASLRNYAGSTTVATLVSFQGADYSGMRLVDISNERKIDGKNFWLVELEFVQVGT